MVEAVDAISIGDFGHPKWLHPSLLSALRSWRCARTDISLTMQRRRRQRASEAYRPFSMQERSAT